MKYPKTYAFLVASIVIWLTMVGLFFTSYWYVPLLFWGTTTGGSILIYKIGIPWKPRALYHYTDDPDHAKAIISGGFNKPHNEAIFHREERVYMGQGGADKVSFFILNGRNWLAMKQKISGSEIVCLKITGVPRKEMKLIWGQAFYEKKSFLDLDHMLRPANPFIDALKRSVGEHPNVIDFGSGPEITINRDVLKNVSIEITEDCPQTKIPLWVKAWGTAVSTGQVNALKFMASYTSVRNKFANK